MKSKSAKLSKLLISAALASACLLGIAACSSSPAGTGGVAATVNGEKIMEDDVTDYIAVFRKNNGLEEDEAWASWMETSGMTPETVREQVIGYYKSVDLVKQAAKDKGVSIAKADIDAQVDTIRGNYDSDEAWETALSSAGTTEEEYREGLEASMLQKKLQEVVLTENTPEPATDDEVIEYLNQYAPMFDGAKRSSHILFNSGDEAKAREVLDKINSGELDFADAAKQYSTDTASAENGGDVGWDQLNSFVTEYTDALAGLESGQVSDLVTSDFGIHIIKCTEVFNAPESVTAIDQVPAALVQYVRAIADDNLKVSAYNDWISEYEEKAEVNVSDMPEGLPYDIEMKPQDAESAEADGAESGSEQPAEGDVAQEDTEKEAE